MECPAKVEEKETEKTVMRGEAMVKVKMVAKEEVRAEVMKKEGAAVDEGNCDSTCKTAHAHQGSE